MRLSISTIDVWSCTSACTASIDLAQYGSKLTSLRVLEVLVAGHTLHAPLDVVDATVALIGATSTTLRSLAIVSGSDCFTLEKVRQFLASAGKHLHYLSLFLPGECAVEDYQGGRGVLLQPMSARTFGAMRHGDERLFFPRATEAVDEDGFMFLDTPPPSDSEPMLPSELDFDEDEEMQTEMLSNMAQGMCISLLEPARIMAHAPGWGAEARRQCEAVLPPEHWLC